MHTQRTGAVVAMAAAAASGIDICFMNPGTTEIPLVSAIGLTSIRPVLVAQEGVAAGAADGYYRASGRPAMTLLHLGPGLANAVAYLHDARRAGSGVLNLIGEHASWHLPNDPPLAMDIDALAGAVSGMVRRPRDPESIAPMMIEAAFAARRGCIATVILSHDLQLAMAPFQPGAVHEPEEAGGAADLAPIAARLRAAKHPAFLLGGAALGEGNLRLAARLAAGLQAKLFVETFPGVLLRGRGLPALTRLGYFPEAALKQLAPHDAVLLIGARTPVAFFGYPDIPGVLLDGSAMAGMVGGRAKDVATAMALLADLCGCGEPSASPNYGSRSDALPPAPRGEAITTEAFAAIIADAIPEGAIVVDEGNCTSAGLHDRAHTAAPHRWMTQGGGAIGLGMPAAAGAALAAPDRPVIALQADGSALYTLQALWLHAREKLNVTTVLCNNRSYQILGIELERAGRARSQWSDIELGAISLSGPEIDWVGLARSFGVEGRRAESTDELALCLQQALSKPGPFLIEAMVSS